MKEDNTELYDGLPMILDTDDLVMMIGTKVVQYENAKRLAEAWKEKATQFEAKALELASKNDALLQTVEELKQSNRTLSERNIALDQALTSVTVAKGEIEARFRKGKKE